MSDLCLKAIQHHLLVPSQISVIQETQSSGPYCSLVLSVTVIKDVVLFLLFAICTDLLSTVRGFRGADGAGLGVPRVERVAVMI